MIRVNKRYLFLLFVSVLTSLSALAVAPSANQATSSPDVNLQSKPVHPMKPPLESRHAALEASPWVVTPPDYVEVINRSDLTFFGWLITSIVGFASLLFLALTITMTVLQLSSRKEQREERDTYTEKILALLNANQELSRKSNKLELQLKDMFQTLRSETDERIRRLEEDIRSQNERFMEEAQKRYQEEILAYIQARTDEVLLSTPKAQDLMVSILRRAASAIAEAGELTSVAAPLNAAVRQWRILGRLYHSDTKEIQNGLLEVRDQPFPDALRVLEDLEKRYKDDLALYPQIIATIKAVEESLGDTLIGG